MSVIVAGSRPSRWVRTTQICVERVMGCANSVASSSDDLPNDVKCQVDDDDNAIST